MPKKPRLFVVSGPSGAGKGTLLARVRMEYPDLAFSVSATTRKPREGEIDGVHYHFLSEEQFDRLIEDGGFLEWAKVHEHKYGTLVSEVESKLDAGFSVALDIDVQGGLAIRDLFEDAVLIFIEPPSLEELERRLRNRGTEDEEEIQIRLANARGEMEFAGSYDVVILNDDLDIAVAELLSTITAYENMM